MTLIGYDVNVIILFILNARLLSHFVPRKDGKGLTFSEDVDPVCQHSGAKAIVDVHHGDS
jgi:hypothetical protein